MNPVGPALGCYREGLQSQPGVPQDLTSLFLRSWGQERKKRSRKPAHCSSLDTPPTSVQCLCAAPSPAGAGGWKPGPGWGMESGGSRDRVLRQKTGAGLMKYGLTGQALISSGIGLFLSSGSRINTNPLIPLGAPAGLRDKVCASL